MSATLRLRTASWSPRRSSWGWLGWLDGRVARLHTTEALPRLEWSLPFNTGYPPPPASLQNLENKSVNLRLCARSLSFKDLHAKSRKHGSYAWASDLTVPILDRRAADIGTFACALSFAPLRPFGFPPFPWLAPAAFLRRFAAKIPPPAVTDHPERLHGLAGYRLSKTQALSCR
jgi:hypothetical protein